MREVVLQRAVAPRLSLPKVATRELFFVICMALGDVLEVFLQIIKIFEAVHVLRGSVVTVRPVEPRLTLREL